MVPSSRRERRDLFHAEPWAKLLIDTLYHYRSTAYLLHEFVTMAGHFHDRITPQTSLDKAVQFIKGGFSYRAKKGLGSNMEVWQKGFQDHRICDARDRAVHVRYVHNDPIKERFCDRPEEFPYSSAHFGVGFELDAVPQGLKPPALGTPTAARLRGVPFQNNISNQVETNGAARVASAQSPRLDGASTESAPQSGARSNTQTLPPQSKAKTA